MGNEVDKDLVTAFGVSEEDVRAFHEEVIAPKKYPRLSSTWDTFHEPQRIKVPPHVVEREMPLQLGPWLTRQRLRSDGELRAHTTANLIRHYTDAVVISLYNKKLGKNELCVERSVLRAVWKLFRFRFSQWWDGRFPKKAHAR